MKTTKNINQIAKVTFASVTFLFASLMPMQAFSGKNGASGISEVQAASNELAMFNKEIEETVAFSAPAEKSEAFDLYVAESELEQMFENAEQHAAYVSPSVQEDFEVSVAVDNLDSLNKQIEQSVKFTAPDAE